MDFQLNYEMAIFLVGDFKKVAFFVIVRGIIRSISNNDRILEKNKTRNSTKKIWLRFINFQGFFEKDY